MSIIMSSIQVSSTRQALEHLAFLQRILDPFLEAYGMAAAALLQLPDNDEVEGEWTEALVYIPLSQTSLQMNVNLCLQN